GINSPRGLTGTGGLLCLCSLLFHEVFPLILQQYTPLPWPTPQKFAVNPPASPALIRLGRYVPVVLLVATIATVYALGWHRTFSLETLVGNRAAIDEFIHRHGAAAVLAYVGLYAMVTAGALPGGGVLAGGVGWLCRAR